MLEISNLRAGYGQINILWDVALNIPEGRLTTIIGPNGAGKTTLLRTIMGVLPITQGEIRLDGNALNGTSTWDMASRRITLIPEGRMVFTDMSVEENLLMGSFPKHSREHFKLNLERSYDLFPRLKERRRQLAGSLSGGEAQMLAMGRGLMADPKILLIDEPSLGLAPVIVQEIFNILNRLKQERKTIVLVEQNTHKAVGVADYVHLMLGGKVLMSKPAAEVNLETMHDLYFSRE